MRTSPALMALAAAAALACPLMTAYDQQRSGYHGSAGSRKKRRAKQFSRLHGRRMRAGR